MEKKTSDPSKRNRDFSKWNGDESSQRSDFSKNKGWFSNEMLVIFQNKADVTHQTHTSESEWWWCANEMAGASNWSERSGPWGPQSWSVDSLWNYEWHPPPMSMIMMGLWLDLNQIVNCEWELWVWLGSEKWWPIIGSKHTEWICKTNK